MQVTFNKIARFYLVGVLYNRVNGRYEIPVADLGELTRKLTTDWNDALPPDFKGDLSALVDKSINVEITGVTPAKGNAGEVKKEERAKEYLTKLDLAVEQKLGSDEKLPDP